MPGRIFIALGGNALGNTPEEQKKKIDAAAPALVGLISQGYEIIVSHGNGPQVGMINLAFAERSKTNQKIPQIDLPECTAMSQGYIGYHLPAAHEHFFSGVPPKPLCVRSYRQFRHQQVHAVPEFRPENR